MEKYKVKVHMKGTQIIDGVEDETMVNAEGYCTEKDGSYYIIYDEMIEEHTVKTMIKLGENTVEVIKRGDVESKMVFAPGAEDKFRYSTPFGLMDMMTKTDELNIFQSEGNFKINIQYDLYVGGVLTSKNKMFIRIRKI